MRSMQAGTGGVGMNDKKYKFIGENIEELLNYGYVKNEHYACYTKKINYSEINIWSKGDITHTSCIKKEDLQDLLNANLIREFNAKEYREFKIQKYIIVHETCNNYIECPYCGYEASVGEEYNDCYGAEFQCGSCEKIFELTTEITVEYKCEPIRIEVEKIFEDGDEENE